MTLHSRMMVVLVAVLFSTGGAAIKFASMSAWQIAGLRSLVAFGVLFLLAPAARQKPSRLVLGLAIPYAGVMVLFVHANTMASAGSVTLLQATAPLYVLLLAPLATGQRTPLRAWMTVPVFVLGMLVLLSEKDPSTAIATAPALGRWLAAGAGLCFGLTILGLSAAQASNRGGVLAADQVGNGTPAKNAGTAIQAVAYGNLLASVISLPVAILNWVPVDTVDVTVALYLGAIQIGLAYAILLPAMRLLSATEVSLLLLVELVTSPLFAAGLHGEAIGVKTVVGGLIILGACVVNGTVRSERG